VCALNPASWTHFIYIYTKPLLPLYNIFQEEENYYLFSSNIVFLILHIKNVKPSASTICLEKMSTNVEYLRILKTLQSQKQLFTLEYVKSRIPTPR
jgi:hypothetical membrane protein